MGTTNTNKETEAKVKNNNYKVHLLWILMCSHWFGNNFTFNSVNQEMKHTLFELMVVCMNITKRKLSWSIHPLNGQYSYWRDSSLSEHDKHDSGRPCSSPPSPRPCWKSFAYILEASTQGSFYCLVILRLDTKSGSQTIEVLQAKFLLAPLGKMPNQN